jgi:hypothetical protein
MAKKKGEWPKKPSQAKKELPPGLTRALATRKKSADSEALLTHLIEIWGGTERLAKDIYTEFQKASAGGMTRQRILEMLQRLILTTTDRGLASAVRPSDMSDEELEEMAMSYAERVTNGKPTPATAAEPS